jgi:SAM-dependent methyltransferase
VTVIPSAKIGAQRATELFGWTRGKRRRIPSRAAGRPVAVRVTGSTQPTTVSLVVGVIADVTRPNGIGQLARDLLRLQPDLDGLDVVMLENGPRTGAHALDDASRVLRDAGAGCYIVPLARQIVDAAAGLFGERFERRPGHETIAVARTMLQTYLWVVARARKDAVVWIVDGDCRLDNLVWDGRTIAERPVDLARELPRLRASGIQIAIGTVTDAPPVPFASCIRTQLVDAYHNLEAMAAMAPDTPWPDRQVANMETRARYEDYYYDLSRRETDHLETPFWYVPKVRCAVRDAFKELVSRLPRMLAGEEVFRPIVVDERTDPLSLIQPSIHRGGNTFVFDVESLRDFPNAASSVDGTETRRSDMVWSLLNRYVAHRTVVKLPLAIRQDRQDEPVGRLDMEKLARDIQGYALYSALEDVLLEGQEGARWVAGEAASGLDGVDPKRLEERMKKYLRERLAAFSLSFHRAAGLSQLLGKYVGEGACSAPWWLTEADCAPGVEELRDFVARLRVEYDLARLREFQRNVSAVGENVARQFLEQLRHDLRARAESDGAVRDVERWMDDERVAHAEQKVRREFGAQHLRLLGSGAEAVVLTDEHTVFKHFDRWKTPLSQTQVEFLRGQIGRWEGIPGLYALRDLRSSGSWAVVTYDYEPSVPYEGGHGGGLVRLLQGCRRGGIVCSNLHPDNLVVTATGLKLVDYGADIGPFSAEAFEQMMRRAFLCWRHATTADLKELMRRALSDPGLPELTGLGLFREAVEPVTKELLLDARIAAALGGGWGRLLLEYGCGKGKLAATLSTQGWSVTAYDPDPSYEPRWRRTHGDGVTLGGRALLGELRKGRREFDAVLCSLVLCLLDDEALRQALADLRRFTKPGGRLVVAVCNPRFVHGTTQLQQRLPSEGKGAEDVFRLEKRIFSTSARIVDVHRSLQQYVELFAEHGLAVETIAETPGVDLETFEPTSDFMIFDLRRSRGEEVLHACP